ncbi:MAG: 7-keto-8-aminopelargonate synthetase-like enzyme/predicted N-acyltransferase [Arenicella sp.]|jgi:7-keto-8-aminopelargonate synthetase-like enzyme/predicted N-acyltransferase
MNNETIKTINGIANYAKSRHIAHLHTTDSSFEKNLISVNSNKLVNFGSCSYLGLEFERSLKKGAINAIENFGTQFSSSRAYMALGLYEQLEFKLDKIFQGHTVVTPTTTLGHIAAIPILIGKNDLVIMDHQVHNSVQTAVGLIKNNGSKVELLRHNRMDLLEKKIKDSYSKYDKIWYLADGIYSMYGDKTPIEEIYALLNKYRKFNFYVDDAHAMSCFGERGQGYVLENRIIHERMVVATSLNKAFASGGGVLIFPNQNLANLVKNCGGPLITSGPMQPGALGAANAAAEIHLSNDIIKYQAELKEKIKYTHLLLQKCGLPNLAEEDSPIFFIGVGLPKVGYNLVDRLVKEGHYLNLGIFPAVPIKNTGVRFTITRLHTFEQIENMVSDMAKHYHLAIQEEGFSIDQVYKAFKIAAPESVQIESEIRVVDHQDNLEVICHNSIIDLSKEEWDHSIGAEGMYSWEGMNVLEKSFSNNLRPEENWSFDFLTIKDKTGNVILNTFFTSGIVKDDMLAAADLSEDIEKIRLENPSFYTSKFLCIGSMVSEGNHLYLVKTSPFWKEALQIFFTKVEELQKKYDASTTIIRDLPSDDILMDDIMVDNGFFKSAMPESFSVDVSKWNPENSFLETLSKRSKKHFKQNVRRFEKFYSVRNSDPTNEELLKVYYQLYLNVHSKGLEINTFKLPYKFFQTINSNKNWDIITLNLIPDEQNGLESEKTVGVVFAYKGISSYIGGMVGIDYDFNREFGVYRQAIYQFIKSGKLAGFDKFDFGFCAGIEKKKFGAIGHKSCAYMQVKDNFKFESLLTNSFGKEVKHEAAFAH